mmetsp:Transcript_42848/g.118442  ORF Transcript_42848/g.118442 Transcript_42848/m.118442 type:complete len:729 (-) Transcript_42848:102-2288(-)
MQIRSGAYRHQSNHAKWEQERQEIARLRRLADVRPVVKSKARPPRPQAPHPSSQPPSRYPSVESSRHETPASSPGELVLKRRTRSVSPRTRLEPLQHGAPSPGPALRPAAQPPAALLDELDRGLVHDPIRGLAQHLVGRPGPRRPLPPVAPQRRALSSEAPRQRSARRGVSPGMEAKRGKERRGRGPLSRESSVDVLPPSSRECWTACADEAKRSELELEEEAQRGHLANPDAAGPPPELESAAESSPVQSPAAPQKTNDQDLSSAGAIQDWLAQANQRLAAAFAPVGVSSTAEGGVGGSNVAAPAVATVHAADDAAGQIAPPVSQKVEGAPSPQKAGKGDGSLHDNIDANRESGPAPFGGGPTSPGLARDTTSNEAEQTSRLGGSVELGPLSHGLADQLVASAVLEEGSPSSPNLGVGGDVAVRGLDTVHDTRAQADAGRKHDPGRFVSGSFSAFEEADDGGGVPQPAVAPASPQNSSDDANMAGVADVHNATHNGLPEKGRPAPLDHIGDDSADETLSVGERDDASPASRASLGSQASPRSRASLASHRSLGSRTSPLPQESQKSPASRASPASRGSDDSDRGGQGPEDSAGASPSAADRTEREELSQHTNGAEVRSAASSPRASEAEGEAQPEDVAEASQEDAEASQDGADAAGGTAEVSQGAAEASQDVADASEAAADFVNAPTKTQRSGFGATAMSMNYEDDFEEDYEDDLEDESSGDDDDDE